MNRLFISIVVFAFVVSGCASINSGTTQQVTIDSDPPGATVIVGAKVKKADKYIMVNSVNAGVTPLVVELSRKDGMVEVSKEGYESQEVELKKSMNPWMWGDIVLTSLLSTSIDTSTGACNQYKPGQYMVTLTPKDSAEVPKDSAEMPKD